ncbi:MAG: DUF1003 domain-containing protein [Armatimonadota bacterium]
MRREARRRRCAICGRELPLSELIPGDSVREPIASEIREQYPEWSAAGLICARDLNHFRTQHVQRALEAERGELTALEAQVLSSLREDETLARDINREFDRDLTVGERIADRVAEFGGSWRFILSFGAFLAVWILVNSTLLVVRPWDPYPFILLNLLLSCLAALQAPIIMMSQNRLEAKDRLRAENDYRVNLKAELEIRSLHAKLDLLLSHQWQRLLEIQEIQTEMMEELVAKQSNR